MKQLEKLIIEAKILTEPEAEVERVMQVCNACRYCEGFCAVFPAMTQRLEFGKADINYLANLCHNCGACLHACQYAPPHEFGINVPKAMAEVRLETYQHYAQSHGLRGAVSSGWRHRNAGIGLKYVPLFTPDYGAEGSAAPPTAGRVITTKYSHTTCWLDHAHRGFFSGHEPYTRLPLFCRIRITPGNDRKHRPEAHRCNRTGDSVDVCFSSPDCTRTRPPGASVNRLLRSSRT